VEGEPESVGERPEDNSWDDASWGSRSPERALEIQRARLMDAAVEVVGEAGVRAATVAEVGTRANLSRTTFYNHFKDSADCVLAAHRRALGRLTASISEAFAKESAWSEGVVAGLAALVAFMDVEPQLAQVLLVECFALGPVVLEQRREELGVLRPLLDAGRAQLPPGDGAHPWQAEATIEGLAALLRTRAMERNAPPFTPLLGELVSLTLGHYRAQPREREEAQRRVQALVEEGSATFPRPSSKPAWPPAWSSKSLGFRMERCLRYLAAYPGASNGEVAKGIDLGHQGQVSRMLSRLREKGLLARRPGGAGKPNAWWLTPEGELYAQAIEKMPR
jgi:AcrR family transcriptional regulator